MENIKFEIKKLKENRNNIIIEYYNWLYYSFDQSKFNINLTNIENESKNDYEYLLKIKDYLKKFIFFHKLDHLIEIIEREILKIRISMILNIINRNEYNTVGLWRIPGNNENVNNLLKRLYSISNNLNCNFLKVSVIKFYSENISIN